MNNKFKNIAVIGIGRVGLPLALVLSDLSYKVYGIGRDPKKIDSINKGKMPFIERGAPAMLKKHRNKNFIATVDYSVIKECDYIILTLGTPIDENMNPVFEQIENAIYKMIKFLKKDQTIILRSTVSPGTTEYVRSIIEKNTKFIIGKNFYLSYCPERIVEGRAIEELVSIPQIIGAFDEKSKNYSKKLFEKLGVKVLISDPVSSELAKLFTNMYRYINFAIANEFMVIADNYNRNIYEIINLVNSRYKRGGLASPGLTAGPCLFKDGFFLINDLPYADLISTSWKINESIPLVLVKKLKQEINLKNKKVALLGLGFKADSDDVRESLSFKVRKALLKERADVRLHDVFVRNYKYQTVYKDVYQAMDGVDVIFIAANHKLYNKLELKKIKKIAKNKAIVCDIWNVFNTGRVIFRLKDFS